jgi:hypothetical protein
MSHTAPMPGNRKTLMFGYTEEQIAGFGLSFGVGGFMLYMLFIIGTWPGSPRPANLAPS